MKRPFGWLWILLLSLGACSSSPPRTPDISLQGDYTYLSAYLSWLIKAEMAKQNIEGLSIAVVDDQQIVWAQGFGYADQAKRLAATPETVYRVGSISKLFTDTLVMQLAEQGKLDIDKPLQSYLPGFAIKSRFQNAGPITPRNLMTHHSGLPGDVGNGMWTKYPAPFRQLAGQLKDEYMAYPPDYICAYSNLGISLLGSMLEQMTGQDFSAYAEQQLLKPLGMANAGFSLGIEGPLASKAYKNHQEFSEAPLRDMPAGGLNANVLDMSRFISMVLADGQTNGRQILKPQTLKQMLGRQNQSVALDADLQTGLGWFLRSTNDIRPIAEHGGATLYHTSLLSLSPEHKLGVVTLANSRPKGDTLQKINNAALKLAVAARSGQSAELDEREPLPATRELSPQEQERFTGQYATGIGYIKLNNHGGSLTAEIDGKKMELVAREDGKLGMRYLLLGFIPIQVDELSKVGLSLSHIGDHEAILVETKGQSFVFGEKIKPARISTPWQYRLGEYEIVNLAEGEAMVPENCALRERDGLLLLEYALPGFDINRVSLPIEPVADNEAIILGLGRGMRETMRLIKQDGEELVAYSGYLLRKKATD